MSPTRFLVALTIILSFSRGTLSIKEGFYTIIVPGTIRSESVFNMSIGLSDFHQSCWFNITLKSLYAQLHESYPLKTIEIHPNTIKLVSLTVPSLYSKSGSLEILGYRGIINTHSAYIKFEHESHSVFIQTNKVKYKLGELVQFRVICIDQLTLPAQIDKMISVLIYDSQENLIKHISNVKLVQGVFKGEFQLSENTILGEWKINVEVGDNTAAEKSFEVSKYVLPEFLVRITTKSNVAIDENKIVLAISANYFYGEPVKGNLVILLEKTYSSSVQDELPMFRREFRIDENATFVLDMKNDLKIENKNKDSDPMMILYKFKVQAFVTDALTEQKSMTETEIIIHSQRYKIKLQAPKEFHSDETDLKFLVKVSVTDLEGTLIQDPNSSVKITAECISGLDIVKAEFTHQIGIDYANIKIENKDFSDCKLYADYQGIRSPVERIKRNMDIFYLDVLTESPEVGNVLEVKLKSLDPIEHFSYEIVSRGDIIQSEYIIVPESRKSHIFRFNVTYAMVPKITIYAHRVKERVFSGQLKDVFIKRAFQNSIDILTDNETKPGSLLYVNVTTDADSYVGLMGLDQRLLQNLNDADDLTEDHLYTKLRNYDASSIDTSMFPGIKAGLLTFSNAFTSISGSSIGSRFGDMDYAFVTETDEIYPEPFDKPSLEFPRIRKLFSESWLFKDFERTPAGGFASLETVPDTITSWAITGFSLNPKTGLTLTKNATNLKVFQDFFVSIDLPSFVTEGETVEVPIYISNYMREDVLTNFIIEKDSENIEILKRPDAALMPSEAISILVPASKREQIKVFMKPLKSGEFNVTVKAFAPMASDAVQKTLKVKSEGVPYEISKTYLVHLPEESIQENEITIDIPDHAVPGSQRADISIVGDIFRPLLRSLQKMARVPYGNGEDNIRFVISNWLVLKYFKALNYKFPSLESKIRLNLELGYQNQLCFKHLDGSFSLFDRTTERRGDIWQTAFALWGLKESKNFIHVDSKVFERGLNYLKTRQQENGCFKSLNDVEQDIEYTAFSIMVFLMDNHWRTTHFDVITKGLMYLYNMSDSLGQSSTSVLSTYVLLLGRHEKARDCLKKLTTYTSLISKQMFWKKSDTLQSHLETTADSLMNLFESQENTQKSLLHIIRGLITFDGGKSSLTHIIALHIMLVFIEDLNLSKKNLTVFFNDNHNGSDGKFQLNSANSQVLQSLKLSDKSRRIHLQSNGYGFAVVEVKYKYNLVLENQSSSVYATNTTTQTSSSSSLNVFRVCASVLRNNTETNHLTVMEVTLQSGYVFTEKVTPEIGLTWKFKSIKVNDNRDMLVVYIANINNKGICLKLETLEKYKVLNAKPGWVVLYDAHNKVEKTTKSFKI